MKNKQSIAKNFIKLLEIMELLRSAKGCPWDRKQTFLSLRQYVIEEAYEVIDAIEKGDYKLLCDELGDLLMQVVFLSQIGKEKNKFDINRVIEAIIQKMIRRHPHVFGEEKALTPEDVLEKWGAIKRSEGRQFILEGIPSALPALLQAFRIGQKVGHAGFDWEKPEGVIKKIEEELQELRKALNSRRKKEIEKEYGDLLFSMVNLARWLRFNPELALRKTNRKFIKRVNYMEKILQRRNQAMQSVSAKYLETLLERAKKRYP